MTHATDFSETDDLARAHATSREHIAREVARRRAVHAFSTRRLAIELEAVERGEEYPTAEREWPLLPEEVTPNYPFRPWRMRLPPRTTSDETP